MKRLTNMKRFVFGLAAVVLLLVVDSALSYRNTQQLYEDANWVSHTHEVIATIDETLLSLVVAQDGFRGYVATGLDMFIQSYRAAVMEEPKQITHLKTLTADNPDQQQRIDKLNIAIAAYLEHLRIGIDIAREQNLAAARAFVGTGEGERMVRDIKAQTGTMKVAEEQLLRARTGRKDHILWLGNITNLIVTALGLLMVLVVVRLVERGLRYEAKASALIHEQRELLHATLLSIGDAVIATDPAGCVTFLNPLAQKMTGWVAEDATGKHLDIVFRIVNETTREPVDNPALRALAEGAIVGLANHTVLIARDGTERPIDDSAAPIRTQDGKIAGAVLVFRDITARHQAAADIAAANQRNAETVALLDAVLMNAPIGIGLYDNDLRFVKLNDALAQINGLPLEMHLGRTISEVLPGIPEEILEDLRKVQRTGQPLVQKEITRRMPNTSTGKQHLFVNYYPVSNPAGTKFGIGATVLDVTLLKQSEDALRESESRLRFVMSSMPQKIFTAKPNGDVDYFNPEWINYTGLTFDQIRDWGWTQFVHEDDVEENTQVWKAALASGKPFLFEHRIRRADGEYRWHVSRAVALKDETGNVGMWVGSNTDIHEERQTANELRRLAAELSQADTRKDEFLATLAHELRNPLAPIRNGLNLMRISGDKEQFEQARTLMDRQLTHMVRLVDDLMDVSRINRGSIELRKEPVELANVINNAVEASRPMIEKMGHALTIALPDHPVLLSADLTRLAQVFSNLLNNAAKYSDSGGRIRLTAQHLDNAVVVFIQDDGIGIPADKLDTIFEMFAQVDQSLEKSQGGLGIGLTLVRRLVEMHGGTVVAHSEGPGTGSTLTVRLPVAIASAAQPSALETPAIVRKKGLRVLIVDDNRDSADSLAMVLQMMGHETRTAYDGMDGVAAAKDLQPDVILMDIGLPKLNGYEACRRIRELPWAKHTTIVAITGWGQDADRRRSQEAGFNRHVVKPIDPDSLSEILTGVDSTVERPS